MHFAHIVEDFTDILMHLLVKMFVLAVNEHTRAVAENFTLFSLALLIDWVICWVV